MGLLRIVDESGADSLYPVEYFRPVIAARNLFQHVEGK